MAVFISYRREDSEGEARAIYNRLAQETDEHHLFLDVEAIGVGEKWKTRIDDMLKKVEAVVVIIGPRWLDLMNARTESKIFDSVRSEVAASLDKPGVQVIPVLVNGARPPTPNSLPDDIKGLTDVNAIEVRGSTWKWDTARLVQTLRKAGALPTSRRRWAARVATVVGVFAAMAIVATLVALRVTVPDIPVDMSISQARQLIESRGLRFELGEHGDRAPDSNRKVNLVRHPFKVEEIEDILKQQEMAKKGDLLKDCGRREVAEMLKQEPASGTVLFRGQTVVVHFCLAEPYRLVCRAGGFFESRADDNLYRIEKYGGPPSPNMTPGSCAWLTGPLRGTEAYALRPLGFGDELPERFRKAPGGLLAFCAKSQYSRGRSPRLAALSVHDFMRPDDDGKLFQRITDYVCIESDL